MQQIIECVPNISEGRNETVIKAIAHSVKKIPGVRLLDIDPGAATNRTVITFVGDAHSVVDAAFVLISKAYELIDMSTHSGEHPRFGAVDVCPFIPVSNATMEDCIDCAQRLAKRVGEELKLSGYLYENAATQEERRNLANVRSGEYEGIAKKIIKPEWKPDFGPTTFNPKYGLTAISARDFLVAYNVNLNTTSTRRANAIAFDIREAGRALRIPGKLKACKAIGWYIEEYGIAQISVNLTNINITSVHECFEATSDSAIERGLRVTGSELVGLIPLNAMLDAGKYFLKKQQRSTGIAESEIIKIAIKSLGLDELSPFDPQKKIIEYILASGSDQQLVQNSLAGFVDETASESPAPGGGSIAAYVGSLGAALGTMVANLSAHKRGWDDRWEEFSNWAEKGQSIQNRLLFLVDEDTRAFNKIIEAIRLPKSSADEKAKRKQAIEAATKFAIEVPYQVMETAFDSMELLKAMAEIGNPNSVSDAGVGALCARTAVLGAYLNVQINCKDLGDEKYVDQMLNKAKELAAKTEVTEKEILEVVQGKL
ncbi:UNVERIFIED_CONTAM: hypothetical protein GTU68_031773 [Idotea baltica]|nr:hypothetical protein [Idotea baltica]